MELLNWFHFTLDREGGVLLPLQLLLYLYLQQELPHYAKLFLEWVFTSQELIMILFFHSIDLFDEDSHRIIDYRECCCLLLWDHPIEGQIPFPLSFIRLLILLLFYHFIPLLHCLIHSFFPQSLEHKILSSSSHYSPKLEGPQRTAPTINASFSYQILIDLFFADEHMLSLR